MHRPSLLNGPAFGPAAGGAPRAIVVLLHGVGADGNDLLGLAPLFAETLPHALFLSPNAPFPYDMAPFGYQWFSVREFTLAGCLAGVQTAAPILDAFIDRVLARHGLAADRLALVGFSQGAMIALHVGLRRASPLAGLVGYSGMLVGSEGLGRQIKSRPPVLLVHGEADPLVPFHALAAAAARLKELGIDVASHGRPGLGHGIDEEGIRLGIAFLERCLASTPPSAGR